MYLKKDLLFSLIIVLFICFIDIILNNNFFYQKENMENMIYKIKNLEMENKDFSHEVFDLYDYWFAFEKKASYYIEHDELEKVSTKICVIKNNVETQKTEDVQEYLTEVEFVLNHIYEKDKITLKNIF